MRVKNYAEPLSGLHRSIPMQYNEGEIYEGTISLSGGEGPLRRWIVVAPFGKAQIHSIDNPLELHCWPIALIELGVREGKLKFVGTDTNHPVITLQRVKERVGIEDSHLGLHGASLNAMLELLDCAAMTGEAYTPYVAGEILALSFARSSDEALNRLIEDKVTASLEMLEKLTGAFVPGGGQNSTCVC